MLDDTCRGTNADRVWLHPSTTHCMASSCRKRAKQQKENQPQWNGATNEETKGLLGIWSSWNVFRNGRVLGPQRSSTSSVAGEASSSTAIPHFFSLCFSISKPKFHFHSLPIFNSEVCFFFKFNFLFLFMVCKIWKQRLVQMGAAIEERLSKRVTHVFAMDSHTLFNGLDRERLSHFKGVSYFNFLLAIVMKRVNGFIIIVSMRMKR